MAQLATRSTIALEIAHARIALNEYGSSAREHFPGANLAGGCYYAKTQ